VCSHCNELHKKTGRKTINPVMNYFTEIATWILKCTFIAYHCVSPLRSTASLGILRWGNASDQKLEVGELRSPASYYTLTTVSSSSSYRAMHFSAKRGIAIACRLSVCPSVTLVDCDHIGWNSSKIISPLVSLGCLLFATPT